MNEPAHGESAPRRDTHAELSGTSRDTVQAGSVSGGVHFHGHRESHREHDERARGAPAPRQLPGDVRGFVNRADELGQLDAVLPERDGEPTAVSVWVIAGTAGAGKTSLALHWAHRVKERFPDGQLYINLRGYDPREPVTAEEALRRFLPALGVPADAVPSDGEAAADLYRSLLADRRVLVVLDNAATVGQVRPLLPGGEHCLTVVTSRNRLSGLAIRDGAHRLTLGMLPESEAVALLRVVTAGFRRQDGEEALAELSRLCARLPLALRIAAERAASRPHMRLEELIDELRDGSALWDALSSGDEEEAEAVRTVFAWSYRALPADASRVFRLLGLHPGPDFGAGAVAALADLPVRRARQTLDVLVGAHLVEQTGPDRYAFHDLLRVYAAGLAREEREEPVDEASTDPLRRLVNWYLHTAESARRWIEPDEAPVPLRPCDDAARPLVFTTYDQAVEWSERERANVPAAVRSAGEAGWHGLAWRLAAVWYDAQPPSAPAADWLPVGALGLGAARRAGDRPREAWFLDSLGTACRRLNRPEESRARHREALAVWRELGDARGEALSWNLLGLLELRGRRLAEAERAFHHALDVFREVGDERWESILLANRGRARWDAGLLDAAADDVGPALAAHRAGGRAASVGDALSVLSAVHLDRDEPGAALDAAREAVEIALELRDHTLEAYWLLALGAAERALGAYGPALESYQRSAVLHRRLGDRGREALAWHGTGCVYARMERPEDAADFHRRAAAAHRELGDAWHEALALEGLAAALDAAHPEESHHCRTEVLRLTAAFDDPRARELRARVAPESG